MPDITLTCDACEETLTLSEYARPEGLSCPACGAEMAPPTPRPEDPPEEEDAPQSDSGGNIVIEQPDPSKRRASVAHRKTAETEAPAPPASRVVAQVEAEAENVKKARARILGPGVIGAIILVIIGVPLAWYRYAGPIDPGTSASLDEFGYTWGPLVLLVFHVLILLEAYRDEFFFGVMATIVPLYSFAYLYTRSDNQVVKIVFSLFLIVCAIPAYEGSMYHAGKAYDSVTAFIAQSDREAGFE